MGAKSEVVIFKSKKYHRYPESKRRSHQSYFWRTAAGGKTESLHVAIYKHHYGEVPKGSHVHHKDGDSLNNNPGNLICIEGSVHLRKAIADREPIQKVCEHCGNTFQTKCRKEVRFCSNRCKTTARRESGVDDER